MSVRYTNNPNLHLQTNSEYKGLSVQTSRGALAQQYLARTQLTIDRSLVEHPRTMAIRVDLRVPQNFSGDVDSRVITRFMASLKKQIECNTKAKEKTALRVHPCTIRYIWAKESTGGHYHYHVLSDN